MIQPQSPLQQALSEPIYMRCQHQFSVELQVVAHALLKIFRNSKLCSIRSTENSAAEQRCGSEHPIYERYSIIYDILYNADHTR